MMGTPVCVTWQRLLNEALLHKIVDCVNHPKGRPRGYNTIFSYSVDACISLRLQEQRLHVTNLPEYKS